MKTKISIEPSMWQDEDQFVVYISISGNARQSVYRGSKLQCIMVATGFISVGYELSIMERTDVEQGQVRGTKEP